MELQRNPGQLQRTSTNFNLRLLCLQQTFFKDIKQLNIKIYLHYYINKDGNKASGSVLILIRKDIPQHQISIDTKRQGITVKSTLHTLINICSIYILPHDLIKETKVNKLKEQIPKIYLLLGELNSYNTIWGCQKTNKKGKDLEKVINYHNFYTPKNKSQTYLNPPTSSYSAIDIKPYVILQAT